LSFDSTVEFFNDLQLVYSNL